MQKMDRTVFEVYSLHEQDPLAETLFWLSKTPAERWRALETLRESQPDYDNTQSRLQRIYTITERK